MSEQSSHVQTPGDTPRVHPLDYRGPREEPRTYPVALVVAATLFAAGLVVISMFLAVTVSILVGHAWAGTLVLTSAAAVLVGLGYYGHRKLVRRPFEIGIWLGTGIGLLALAVIFIQRAYWR